MTSRFTFDGFEDELIKLAKGPPPIAPKTITTMEQKARWPKPPGMMSTGVPMQRLNKKGPAGAQTGGNWNVRSPTREMARRINAAKSRTRQLRGTDLSEETTIAE